MEDATPPQANPEESPMETSLNEDTAVIKSEPPEVPGETDHPIISPETDDQKPDLSTVSDSQKPPTEIEATPSNSQVEVITVPVLSEPTVVAPVALNSAKDAKEAPLQNMEGAVVVDDKSVDKAWDKTIEEGVSKAVTELNLDQTKEDDQCNVERLQPENEPSEKPQGKEQVEEGNDPVDKDPLPTEDEEKMDVDPCETDAALTGVDDDDDDGVVVGDQDIPIKEEIPEAKEEVDEIDEAWKSEDFDLPPSDDDDEGNYFSEPPPQVIIELYQKLEEGKVLDLEWTCLGRRTPDEDGGQMEVEAIVQDNEEDKVNHPVYEDHREFDFDIDAAIQNKVTPRLRPGFEVKGSGSAKKRVAKMDKVLDDIRRFSKINEEMAKTPDAVLPPLQSDLEVTPQRPSASSTYGGISTSDLVESSRRDLHQ